MIEASEARKSQLQEDAPRIGPVLGTLAALLALTVATTGLAFLRLGSTWHLVLALSIAVLKVGLVAAVFMHLAHASRLVRVFALGAVGWLLLLLFGIVVELLTRAS